ncbi:MAG: hypothetical protein MRJ93_03515 [Nitrososphaeraceae archaeon]|nr:hypothetical protein [Nitrososphaeraceae archaeon]
MPIFLDVHNLSEIGDIINMPVVNDREFNVKNIKVFFNKEVELFYYLLEAHSKEVIERHHLKFNLSCNSIMEVTMMDK